jgi:hypothetical protein
LPTTDKPRRRRSTKAEAQARAGEAFSLSLAGVSYGEIATRLGYGNMGNAYRAVQRYIDSLPDVGNTARRRAIEHQRLDAVWKMAYAKASTGDVPAMRVLVEISRRRALLDGLDKPTVLQIDGPGETQQQAGPTLREVLPAEVVAEPRLVRQQALALHRALPALPAGQEQAG